MEANWSLGEMQLIHTIITGGGAEMILTIVPAAHQGTHLIEGAESTPLGTIRETGIGRTLLGPPLLEAQDMNGNDLAARHRLRHPGLALFLQDATGDHLSGVVLIGVQFETLRTA